MTGKPTVTDKQAWRGRGFTVAGGASSRASAAPTLRFGPSGDPPPATVRAAYMAGSKLPARH